MSKGPPDSQLDESDYEVMKKRVRDLEEKLAILTDGTQVNRDEYEALKKQYRAEQDDNIRIINSFRHIKSQLEEKKKKCAKYEQVIKKYKELSQTGDKADEYKDHQILELQKRKSEMESLNVKHRQDLLSNIAEKKELSDANRRLEAHIHDLDNALSEMYERNKQLTEALQKSEIRNEQLNNELEQEKEIVAQLEHKISILKDNEIKDQRYLQESRHDAAETNYANAQQQLLVKDNEISELKAQIEKLKSVEKKAERLQIELAKQKQINRNLEDQNDELQMKIESTEGTETEYQKQIKDLRDRIQELDNSYADRIDAMKIEVDLYRKRTEKEFKINTKLEMQISDKEKENEDLRDEMNKYLDKQYGLLQAVNEMRQLKTMVSVRDAKIADLINENQLLQKIVCALEEVVPSEIDLDKFFSDIQKREIEFQKKRAGRRISALLKKTLEEVKENNVGEIKVILGPKNVLVYNNESGNIRNESPIAHKILSGVRRSRRASSMNSSDANYDTDKVADTDSFANESESENDLLATSTMSLMMKSKQRKDKERKKKDNIDQAISNIPQISSSKMETADASCQVYPDDFHVSAANTQNSKKDDGKDDDSSTIADDDRWARNMKNKLKKAKSEKDALIEQVKSARDEFNKKVQESEQKSVEIRTLNVRIEELLAQNDQLKAELKQANKYRYRKNSVDTSESDEDSSGSDTSRRRSQRFKEINREDDPLRVELKSIKTQAIAPGIEISISARSVHFEVRPTKLKLTYEYNENEVFQLPTPDELEVIDANIKILQGEVFEAKTIAAEAVREIDDLKRKIEQKNEMIDEMRKTINNLENKLDDQRAAFQEKLTEMNNDAERILEARLKEARDMDAVNNNPFAHRAKETDLSDVSMRMEQLNRDKAKLLDDLTETREAYRFMERQNDQLKDRLNKLQRELNEISEKQMDSSRQKLVDYSSGLKMKYTNLQKKYTDLQRNYEDLKKFKENKNEQLTMTSASRSSVHSTDGEKDGSSSARESSKLKSAMMKIEQMKTQNEEMQLRLGKAQTTIERLNQLLQRKETQLTKVQEQAAQYKHMLAKQQMTKKS